MARDQPDGIVVVVIPSGEASFADFYRREFASQVRRAALLIGDNDVAHDVVHDAFIGIYRRWGTLENPGGYLARSVLNGCRDLGRRRSAHRHAIVGLAGVGRSPGDLETPDVLGDAIGKLPFNQRAAIVLRYYGGMTNSEIAVEIGCPTGSVGPWIDRALTTLRKAMR